MRLWIILKDLQFLNILMLLLLLLFPNLRILIIGMIFGLLVYVLCFINSLLKLL
ncbi:hypothetical protein MA16_Dca026548 [Dendrobium catenatum]|uniref:Uncharacterized protein n=1 Tax=Dendrobium catenatum TaxID=906689 RepID=A0A2I0V7Y7_9ASPA|nr:hypothetical protein MA16_Dca026548 [Dendrobium catenatum]